MVDEEYWHDKRLELRHVLSAWALVLALLGLWLAFTSLGGRLSCEASPEASQADEQPWQDCQRRSQPLRAVAERRTR
jgi:hypothetical protein